MQEFEKELRANIEGELRFDLPSRAIYSVDASIYEVQPLGVALPKSFSDLLSILKIAAAYNVPVVPRGAATGITGGCLGTGLIIDLSKFLNNILEINIKEEYALCEPGVIQDQLNSALASYGYRLGPDTSTGNRATLGGMVANNSAGARSLKYGTMADHLLAVELLLAGGDIIDIGPLTKEELEQKKALSSKEGSLYRTLTDLTERNREQILTHFPKIPRRVSGYNLDRLLKDDPFNLSTLIAGSEGTLGIASKIKVKIAKVPQKTALCLLHIADMVKGLALLPVMLSHHPIALEMIDDKILAAATSSPLAKGKLSWLKGTPQAVFAAEFEADSETALKDKIDTFTAAMHKAGYRDEVITLHNANEKDQVWQVRKAGLGLLLSKRSYSRAIAFIEDLSIPPERLPQFMQAFTTYLKGIGKEAGIYGHIGSGCMHIRPYIDLRDPNEVALMKEIMNSVSTIVLEHGGALSGEHGDGLVRSWLNEKMFGKELYQAFKEVKNAFDPHGLMNPGKIVDGPPFDQHLRLSPASPIAKLTPFLDFGQEGGLELSADLCNGNGECRKREGVMCPSFQASGDEYHTTRARAQTLRSIIHGVLPIEEYTGKAMYDVLDLCIECKGCKRECPSQVDMAKMKSEFLYQYQKKHGFSLRNRLFGRVDTLNKFCSPIARFYNWTTGLAPIKRALALFGITDKRTLPRMASERFSTWYHRQPNPQTDKAVILYNDTYTEYNEPEIGKAAFKLLQALGYHVQLYSASCCGRPLISKGFLEQAKSAAMTTIEALSSLKDAPIVVLEPSCLSALRDDYKGLLGADEHLKHVTSHTWSLEEFLQQHKGTLKFKNEKKEVLVHGHCHQKSLVGSGPTLEVLRSVEGFTVQEITSGCCGMAGSFGYEKEHYDFSMKIGELHLFPAVRDAKAGTIIVASGFSCRAQIEHATGRRAWHLACALADHLDSAFTTERTEITETNVRK